ncbi:MAG: DUF3160 domain-containing protein [bacterium]
MKKILQILALICAISFTALSQTKVDKYWEFIENNPNYNINQLFNEHPVGMYKGLVSPTQDSILYLDNIKKAYGLTSYEAELIDKHGFMVTERNSYYTFWRALGDIYNKDLPVMITTDFILDAFHISYDAILRTIEEEILISNLSKLLGRMQNSLEKIPGLEQNVNDIDIYLTVAKACLSGSSSPKFSENQNEINKIIGMINSEQFQTYPLFSSTSRKIDFSQFTVRGHYTLSDGLMGYFKCMMWLGRTEFYLIPPLESDNEPKQTEEDIQRQIIDAFLLHKLINDSEQLENFNSVDDIIESMVGISDNVQLEHLTELLQEMNISDINEFKNLDKVHEFQNLLSTKEYAEQRILSQILMSPFSKEQIKPASAFLLLGQRFLADSYICGNLVYDKIVVDGQKIKRMLPSVNDVLFSLGNNSSLEFLQTELERYSYQKQLAALRLLFDSYDESYWDNSIYNSWLKVIRTLNAPDDATRKTLPGFMQTAAWWQEKMNTQLSSWAQLRHDNILYGKQSYTGGPSCAYPYVYIEPIPDFYKAMSNLAKKSKEICSKFNDFYIDKYLNNLDSISEKLYTIASKEAGNIKLDENDLNFLCGAFDWGGGCGAVFPRGWIGQLYIGERLIPDVQKMYWNLIADIHTSPFDAGGNQVGWVKHVATGLVDLGVFIAENYEGHATAFVGPVMSFHEYTTNDFKRMNDYEWISFYNNEVIKGNQSFRPEFVDLYLADKNGNPRNDNPMSLPVEVVSVKEQKYRETVKLSAYPNPFSEIVYISFNIPANLTGEILKASIYNTEGTIIKTIIENPVQSGNFTIKWEGIDEKSQLVSSGLYVCQIQIGNRTETTKVVLQRK